MNVQHLIDAVVRQTTALIAQLATAGGVRAPLAHIANQVFLELTTELEAQGVSRKVSADMFGMALRAYIKKIRRLSESSSVRGRSLWEAVLDYVETGGVRTRAEVLIRFAHDDESLVRGALHDLVDTGLISSSGSGASVVYRKTTDEERNALLRNGSGLDEFLWVLIYRQGPLPELQLEQQLGVRSGTLRDALARLQADGRAREQDGRWCASGFAVPLGSDVGWEAALFDHYQALVKTICARLARLGNPRNSPITRAVVPTRWTFGRAIRTATKCSRRSNACAKSWRICAGACSSTTPNTPRPTSSTLSSFMPGSASPTSHSSEHPKNRRHSTTHPHPARTCNHANIDHSTPPQRAALWPAVSPPHGAHGRVFARRLQQLRRRLDTHGQRVTLRTLHRDHGL